MKNYQKILRRLGLVISVLLVMAGLGLGALFLMVKDTACTPYEGSSYYGQVHTRLLPPSYTCSWPARDQVIIDSLGLPSYTQKDFDSAKGPHALMGPYLILLGIAGCVIVLKKRE